MYWKRQLLPLSSLVLASSCAPMLFLSLFVSRSLLLGRFLARSLSIGILRACSNRLALVPSLLLCCPLVVNGCTVARIGLFFVLLVACFLVRSVCVVHRIWTGWCLGWLTWVSLFVCFVFVFFFRTGRQELQTVPLRISGTVSFSQSSRYCCWPHSFG